MGSPGEGVLSMELREPCSKTLQLPSLSLGLGFGFVIFQERRRWSRVFPTQSDKHTVRWHGADMLFREPPDNQESVQRNCGGVVAGGGTMEESGKRQILGSPRRMAWELSELCSCVEGHCMGEVLPGSERLPHLRRHLEKAPQKIHSEAS